jgi:hypothetical protein
MGQDRIDHIRELREALAPTVARLALKAGRRLSMYETYALMIGAIEDRARCDALEIKARARKVSETCGVKFDATPAPREELKND